jgi:hypothetical protein
MANSIKSRYSVRIEDLDTGFFVSGKFEFYNDDIKVIKKSISSLVETLMSGKDLDHHQEETDSLQKSENPDRTYMDEKGLCPKCHGPKGKCDH